MRDHDNQVLTIAQTRYCSVCCTTKSVEFFYTKYGKPQGFCKECTKQKRRDEYAENPEKVNQRNLKSYYKHHDKRLADRSVFRENNKEKISEERRAWYSINKEKVNERNRDYWNSTKELRKANRKVLTHELLLGALDYDKDTGIFTHKTTKAGTAIKGSVAGNLHPFGYIKITIGGKQYFAHRLAWFYVYGSMPNFPIDHINGDSTDNRILNLREDTSGFNAHNRHRANKKNSTGLLGVSRHKNKFQASIRLKWKNYHIGTFNTAEEAHFAYLKAKKEFHPFANINGEPSSPK